MNAERSGSCRLASHASFAVPVANDFGMKLRERDATSDHVN